VNINNVRIITAGEFASLNQRSLLDEAIIAKFLIYAILTNINILYYMAIVTIPLDADLIAFIDEEIRAGNAETKTQVVRQALRRLREERAFSRLREAESDIREGRMIQGDLRKLLEKLPG